MRVAHIALINYHHATTLVTSSSSKSRSTAILSFGFCWDNRTTVSTWPDCFGLMSIYCKCVPAVYGNLSNGRISRNVVKIQPCPFSKKCLSKDCKNTESRNNRFPYLNYFYFWETVILSSLSQFATSTIFIPSY